MTHDLFKLKNYNNATLSQLSLPLSRSVSVTVSVAVAVADACCFIRNTVAVVLSYLEFICIFISRIYCAH